MTTSGLKVLFLTRYPIEGASSRYRVFQYIPHLEALGVRCEVQSFMSQAMYARYFSPGGSVQKVWYVLVAIAQRLSVLLSFRDYDIIYMQRELFPIGPPWVERYMKSRGAILLYDYDDALFINKQSRYNPLASVFRSASKTFDIFRLVDGVIAGNDWLRDTALSHGAKAVTLTVAEDTDRIKMHAPHTNNGPVTLGWLGSTSTVKYLRTIEPALKKIAEHYPNVRFEIMGGGDLQMDGVPWKHYSWSIDDELSALARFDIGLMPLPNEDWALGKSGGKARTYMAGGVVPVCSAIGYNLELIRDGETGFLCSDQAQWYEVISELISDADLRQRIALQAREEIVQKFCVSHQAFLLKDILDDAVAGRGSFHRTDIKL